MTTFSMGRRCAALLLGLTTLAGCTATKPLPGGFYKASATPAAMLPMRVVVITEKAPLDTFRGDGNLVMGKITLQAWPAEAAAMLGEIYQSVSVAPDAAAADDADMLVYLGNDYPRNVSMTFRDRRSGIRLATLSEPALANANTGAPNRGDAAALNFLGIFSFGLFHVAELIMAQNQAFYYNNDIQRHSNRSLHLLRERILKTDELVMTLAEKEAISDIEMRAAAALDSGDAVGALLGYQQALLKVQPGNTRALALQGKAVNAATRITDLPPIPEEAQDLMARGKAALALAEAPADYLPASAAMERSLTLAPWWATGHFNTALTQEGAGLWSSAANHLRLFLQLDPQAPEREQIRQKIAELELHQERSDKPALAP